RAAFHSRNRNAAFALVAANPHSSRRLPACRRQENQLGGARSGLPVAKRLHLHVSQRHRVEPARLPPNREKRRQIGSFSQLNVVPLDVATTAGSLFMTSCSVRVCWFWIVLFV